MVTLRQRFPKDKYPFSDELCLFMDRHPEFLKSLKLSEKIFEFIPLIILSNTPQGHPKMKDEIIGMFYLDKENLKRKKKPLFKQDFVVNVNGANKEFVSYSANNNNGNFVRPIKDFFKLYGDNGKFYHRGSRWEHHYNDVSNLPADENLRSLAISIKKNLEKLILVGGLD